MQYKDYYKILGVDRSADADAIKRAYRKLARKYHPDVNTGADAEDKFKDLQEAYTVLKDPEKRQAYDQLGANWKAGQKFRPPPGWGSNVHFSSDGDFGGFSDFFRDLFSGGGDGFGGFGGGFERGPVPQSAQLRIPLTDAYAGATRTLTLGDGRNLRVQIPKGVSEGQQIRLAGQGSGGGDLFLKVEFEPHRLFRAEGRDIHLKLPIAPWEAALGAKVKVPTLGGAIELTIKPGARAGQKLRLRGRGLPGKPAGDQIVTLEISVPEATTPTQRAAYETLREVSDFNPRAGLES